MKASPVVAGILSLVVPGLGQIYGGHGNRGAAIIVGAVVVANLNVLVLPLIAMANPGGPAAGDGAILIWRYWIPRVAHDVASLWSIVYWAWAVVDAIQSVISNPSRAASANTRERGR
jgi:hypothetical protein